MSWSSLLFIGFCLGMPPGTEVVLHRPVPERLTDRDFLKALEIKVSASWEHVTLRSLLGRLAESYKTAVILDRSIDPNQELKLDLIYQTLAAGFEVVAKSAGAEISILGNTIYLGPADRAAKLRTLAHLRTQEALAIGSPALAHAKTVHWNDLDEPRQLAMGLATNQNLTIENPERIPHDLWASVTLPKATAIEALTLLLIQYDLTFAWNADASAIRLVPVPESVWVEQAHTPTGGPSKRAPLVRREQYLHSLAQEWEQQWPGLKAVVDVDNHRILVQGTLEQHEQLTGKSRLPQANDQPQAGQFPLIRKREFSLKIERVRASDLMKKLEESGVKFQYDPAQLAESQIDLDNPISMDVKKAKADEFFRAIFDPLGLKFSIDDYTVTLTPK